MFSWETANRKLQFAFTRLQFDVVGISNFSKAFAVFRQVKEFHFYRIQTMKKSLTGVQILTNTSQVGVETHFLP